MVVTTLDRIEPGMSVVVLGLEGSGPGRRRLMDMGILPGTTIEVVRRAPLGDPTEYRVKGYNLMMRREDAGRVLVRILAGDGGRPIPLILLPAGARGRIVALRAGPGLRSRLSAMGLVEGANLSVVSLERGRIVVDLGGRAVVLRKGLAMKVMVVTAGD